MDPLGTTGNSAEAADDWGKEFVDAARDLAPGAIRYSGVFSRCYRQREYSANGDFSPPRLFGGVARPMPMRSSWTRAAAQGIRGFGAIRYSGLFSRC